MRQQVNLRQGTTAGLWIAAGASRHDGTLALPVHSMCGQKHPRVSSSGANADTTRSCAMFASEEESAPMAMPRRPQKQKCNVRLGSLAHLAAGRSGPGDCPSDPSHDRWFEQTPNEDSMLPIVDAEKPPAKDAPAPEAEACACILNFEPWWETLAALELDDEKLPDHRDEALQRSSTGTLAQSGFTAGEKTPASSVSAEAARTNSLGHLDRACRSDPDDCLLDPAHDRWWFELAPHEVCWVSIADAKRQFQALDVLPDHRDEAPQRATGTLSRSDFAAGGAISANAGLAEAQPTKRSRAIRMASSFSQTEAISLRHNVSFSQARQKRRQAAQQTAPS
jgi:hypothetical protein